MEYTILTVLVCLVEHLKRPNECSDQRSQHCMQNQFKRLEENHKNQKPKYILMHKNSYSKHNGRYIVIEQ